MNQPRTTNMVEAQTIHQDEELLIRWLPGTSTRLILAFSGVKHGLGGMPMDEFIGTASGGSSNHVLFISDMKRSWYSRKGLVALTTKTVEDFCQGHDIEHIDAIGNSMGGYGAIRFSSELPIRRVAAFAPQVSMDLSVINEKRWQGYRQFFGEELLPSLAEPILKSDAQIFVTFGGGVKTELAQAALLPDAPHLHVKLLPYCHHNVVKDLKAAGMVTPLVNAKLAGDSQRVSEIYDAFNAYNRQATQVISRGVNRVKLRLRRASRGRLFASSRG